MPKLGQFEQSQAAKAGLDGDKENAVATSTPPSSSQNACLASPQDIWGFGTLSSQTSQKGRKVQFGGNKRTPNIHAPPANKTFGKPARYGTRSQARDYNSEGDGTESDVSLPSEPMDDGELNKLGVLVDKLKDESEIPQDPELRKVPIKKKPARVKADTDSPGLNDAELADMLKPTLREQLGLTDAPDSSLPVSSAPQQDMDNIDSYVRELPAEAEEGTACPICHEPVEQDDYWDFWNARNKTVKNQAAFCHSHRKATAQKEYLAEGYPTIDWSKLSERIKRHRMALYNILVGETPSTYRTRYEPLALTGKAAAVPSKRTDLSLSKQKTLASYALDDNAVYPGYYGPRGRRLITESVMSLLNTEIKRSTDAVVQTSGPATFVQAVLVPEVAVRLIMADLNCHQDEAEEIRERTFDMGVLLNEEIEDEVLVADEEDEGANDYHH